MRRKDRTAQAAALHAKALEQEVDGEPWLLLEDALRLKVMESGRSVIDIAEEIGIPLPNLYNFVNGKRELSLHNASRLAACLDLVLVPREGKRKRVKR